MIERFADVFTKGTKMTFKNPVLFLPYLLYTALGVLLLGFIYAATFLDPGIALSLIFLSIPLIFIFAFIEYFIRVGLLGMSKDVVLTGKTSFSQLFRYAKQYFIRVLGIGLITFAVAAIGYVLVFFALYLSFFMVLAQSLDSAGTSSSTGGIGVLIVVGGVGLIWVLVTQMFFYFARYAAIADDLPLEDSIKKSFSLFKANKFKVFIFVLIAFILTYIPNLLMNGSSYLFSYLPAFSEQTLTVWLIIAVVAAFLLSVVFSALMPVWATNMYLWLARKQNGDETGNGMVETNETFIEDSEQEISFD